MLIGIGFAVLMLILPLLIGAMMSLMGALKIGPFAGSRAKPRGFPVDLTRKGG